MATRTVRIALIGAGNLGRRFSHIVADKHDRLLLQFGLDLRLVGVADSQGSAVDANGLDGELLCKLKEAGRSVSELPGAGHPGMTGLELLNAIHADILCEAGPVNLEQNGEPGLSHVQRALEKGMHVSTPNKGPIVLAYRELIALARERNVELRFDGTVAGGLPALALGARDLRGAIIQRIETVPNLTTGFVLDLLVEGVTWEAALEQAREAGALEGDGAWDLDGWDATAKLAILAQAVLDLDISLHDIPMQGIREVAAATLRLAADQGAVIRLLGSAVRQGDGTYTFDVAPVTLGPDHPLGRLGSKQMGIVYHTDIFGTITSIIDEQTPLPSAASMLRDILCIFRG